MATGKRYFWIKLKDTFFTSDTVDFLMQQQNGAEYVVLYQMLCMKTANTSGRMERKLGEVIIPYDEAKIQRDCKFFSIDTVRVALSLYRKLGLVYEDKNGTLVIANHNEMVGSETDYANQKRNQRLQGVDNVHLLSTPMSTECPENVHENVHTDIEIDKEKEKEIRDRDRDRDRMNESEDTASAPAPAKRHQYGTYHNVLFTDEEFAKLQEEFPDWEQRVERLSEYIASKGAKYKNHLATIRAWARKDKEHPDKPKEQNPALNYAQRTYDEHAFDDIFEDLS